MKTLLFTGGGGAGNEALWRLLGQKYQVHFADADREAIDPAIPSAHRHQIPFASDPAFLSSIQALVRELEIDILIPGVDEELQTLADNAEAFEPAKLLLPSPSFIATMSDKLQMAETLDTLAITVPKTVRLDADLGNIAFPAILKPRRGRGSRHVSIVKSAATAQLTADLGGMAPKDLVLQELLSGDEFTVQMVADAAGMLKAIVPVRVDLKRGITLRAATSDNPPVIAACQAIHAAFPTPGCYNIQLMLTPQGNAIPFEINPRVSTTLCLIIAAGIDPIAIFFGEAGSKELLAFKPGLRLARHWQNIFTEKND